MGRKAVGQGVVDLADPGRQGCDVNVVQECFHLFSWLQAGPECFQGPVQSQRKQGRQEGIPLFPPLGCVVCSACAIGPQVGAEQRSRAKGNIAFASGVACSAASMAALLTWSYAPMPSTDSTVSWGAASVMILKPWLYANRCVDVGFTRKRVGTDSISRHVALGTSVAPAL